MRTTLSLALRRTALGLAATVSLFVASVFLTVAAFIALGLTYGTVFAATIVGCAYAALGFGLLALAVRRGPPPPVIVTAKPRTADWAGLVTAFLGGLRDGSAPRRPPPP